MDVCVCVYLCYSLLVSLSLAACVCVCVPSDLVVSASLELDMAKGISTPPLTGQCAVQPLRQNAETQTG